MLNNDWGSYFSTLSETMGDIFPKKEKRPEEDWASYYSGLSETTTPSKPVVKQEPPKDYQSYFGELREEPGPVVPTRWEQARALAEQAGATGRAPIPTGPGLLQGAKPNLGQMAGNLWQGAKTFVPGMIKMAGETIAPLVNPGQILREQGMAQAAQEKAKQMGVELPEQPGGGALAPFKNAMGLAEWWPRTMSEFIKNPVAMVNEKPLDVLMIATMGQGKAIKKGLTVDALTKDGMKQALDEALNGFKSKPMSPEYMDAVAQARQAVDVVPTKASPQGSLFSEPMPSKPTPGEVKGLGIQMVDSEGNPISMSDVRRKPSIEIEPQKPTEAQSMESQSEPLTASKMVLEVLRSEKSLRGKQSKLYSAERSKRFGEALRVGAENPTVEGFKQQLGKLKGELPKVNREAPLESFPEEITNGLIKEIDSKIPGIESVRAKGALLKLFEEGNPLQPSEIELLHKAFGPEFVGEVTKANPKWKSVALDLLGIPRAVMSSTDLSFGLRQGVMMAASHPALFSKAFIKQFSFFASEKAYRAAMDVIAKDEYAGLAAQSKLALTDLGKKLAQHEEPYQSNIAMKNPLVKMSGRAYTGMANKLRFDTFKYLVKRAENLGLDPTHNLKLSKDIASVVNVATGRGRLGKVIEPAAVALNQIFFSPRLLASRLQALNPFFYGKLEPFARKQALRNMFATLGAGTTIVGLAKMAGAEVGTDWRSADFGKIKIGNTRIDIWGGFQQYAKLAGQMITGELVSTTSGKVSTLGEGYRALNRLDIAQRFLESKEAPVFSFAMGLLSGEGQIGEKFKVGPEIAKRFVPMVIADAVELYQEDPSLLPLDFLGVFGMGLQTYAPKPNPWW